MVVLLYPTYSPEMLQMPAIFLDKHGVLKVCERGGGNRFHPGVQNLMEKMI